MRQKTKKFLCFLMAAAMVFSVVTVPSSARSAPEDYYNYDYGYGIDIESEITPYFYIRDSYAEPGGYIYVDYYPDNVILNVSGPANIESEDAGTARIWVNESAKNGDRITVSARYEGGNIGSDSVSVIGGASDNLVVSIPDASVDPGDFFIVTFNDNINGGEISWSVSPSSAATYVEGFFGYASFRANNTNGQTRVTVTGRYNGSSDSDSIYVNGASQESLYVSISQSTVDPGKYFTVTFNSNLHGDEISWGISPSSAASYVEGFFGYATFKANNAGSGSKVTITGSYGGRSDSDSIRINSKGISSSDISLKPSSISMDTGSSKDVTLSVSAKNADYRVTWSSDDTSVATVSGSGDRVTVKSQNKTGTTNIKAVVYDYVSGSSYTESVKVTVNSTDTYNPSIVATVGSNLYSTSVTDSIKQRFSDQFKITLPDNAKIRFTSLGNTNYGKMVLSNGANIQVNTEYTISQLRDMYYIPSMVGIYSLPYTITYQNGTLSGNINVEVRASNPSTSISLTSSSPYTFSAYLPGGSGATVLVNAINNNVGSGNWHSIGFEKPSSAASLIGTLYRNTDSAELTSSARLISSEINNLYFVPKQGGNYEVTFNVYSSAGGNLGTGKLSIYVPMTNNNNNMPSSDNPVVVLSRQAVTANGANIQTEVYNINDENYFKLRDIAMIVNGTGSQFQIGYDDSLRTITVFTGLAYTPVGGELVTDYDKSETCVPTNQTVMINGVQASLTAYNLGGNNFFRLRDLGSALNFNVDYDDSIRTVKITTA